MGCCEMFTNNILFNNISNFIFYFANKKLIFNLKDKYVLLSMVMLCVICAWHAIIAVCPTDVAPHWDNIALISLAIIYTLFHVIFFLWMYFVVSLKKK
jgi:hypothetical protein